MPVQGLEATSSLVGGKGEAVSHRRLPRRFVARALSLREHRTLRGESLPRPGDSARAEQDLARFFNAENRRAWEQYLSLTGTSEEDVLAALGLDFAEPALVAAEQWCALLADILQPAAVRTADPATPGATGLRAPLYPFLNWADARISEWSGAFAFDWAGLRPTLLQHAADLLWGIACKALILEANIVRLRQSGSGGKAALPIADQFAAHVRGSPISLVKFYLAYPALSRLMATALIQWRENIGEVLSRLDRDLSTIERRILGGPAGRLSRIEGTLSDPHDGGRAVLFLTFSTGRKLVYKPRSIAVDVGFQALIRWINDAGASPPLRAVSVAAGADYGWIEFVEPLALPSEDAAHDFYERQGINLALLYVTQGTDFHAENIIASGEHPILVDLETLLHARPRYLDDGPPVGPADQALGDSVFVSGLLPGWAIGDAASASPDISGIGAREGQVYSIRTDVIEEVEGGIRVVRGHLPVAEKDNRPSFDGMSINPALYSADIIRGFEQAYHLLMRNGAELLAEDGPLSALLQARFRHVTLGTVFYSSLLRRAGHPDFLSCAVHRELIFASLAVRSIVQPQTGRLLPSELAALFRGDIPKFSSSAFSRSIFDEHGAEFPEFLIEDAASAVRQRISGLSLQNLRAQKQIIGLALATLARPGEPGAETAPSAAADGPAALPEEILAEIQRIAHRLCDEAIITNGQFDWLGLTQHHDGGDLVSAVGSDLYTGVSGIALFLAHAGRRISDGRLIDAARSCAKTALADLKADERMIGGGYTGRASNAYALLHLAGLLGEPDWIEPLLKSLDQFSLKSHEDRHFDVVAGSAGLCAVLAAAYRATGESRLLEAAQRPAEHLMAKRVDCERGCGWPARNSRVPLTGFSHGAAGIGWALIHIGDLTQRQDLTETGLRAFDYEASLYSPEHAAWPDLRELPGVGKKREYSFAWCHGGPGIGLSRATLPPSRLGAAERLVVEQALEPLLRSSLGVSDCLCHGELGNIELLIEACDRLARPDLREAARKRASAALRRAEAVGSWRCGAIANVEIPGLLTGLAGVGYGLLRAYFPETTPSVLSLSPPLAP